MVVQHVLTATAKVSGEGEITKPLNRLQKNVVDYVIVTTFMSVCESAHSGLLYKWISLCFMTPPL